MPAMLYVRQVRQSENLPYTGWTAYIKAPFRTLSVYADSPADALRRLRDHADCGPFRTRLDRVIGGYNFGLGTIEGAHWYNRAHAYTSEHLHAGVNMATTLPVTN